MIRSKPKKCVECGREDQPWFSKKRCKSCAQKAYSKKMSEQNVNKIKSGEKKQPKLNLVSTKQAARLKEYMKLRNQFLEINDKCERCGGDATEVHHRCGRVGDDLIDTDNFCAVCFPCHQWIETHPAEAKQQGYSRNRLS